MNRKINNIITIATPSFNQGKYIEQTIKSVIYQSGDFYIDYIIADGGSKDETVDILKKYDKLINSDAFKPNCLGVNLTWWSKPDKGQSSALNKAFAKAKGDVLAWINSDDYYEDNIFGGVLEQFKKNKDIELVYGDGRMFYEDSGEEIIINLKTIEINFYTLLNRCCNFFQPSTFFTRKIFNKVGRLDENLHYSMDYELWLKITDVSEIKYYNQLLSNFRLWHNSKTVSHEQNFKKENKKIYKKYGGNYLNKRLIEKFRHENKMFDWLKAEFPSSYEWAKNKFYNLVDQFHYKRERK